MIENTKSMAWTAVALQSSDQLRQRMAFALSQIFVTSVHGVIKQRREAELWLTYCIHAVAQTVG